ncbi:MAG: cation:proton antiporter [Micrococcales bacterium]|nr:cation:proton antiporter [Micrococcales bacterium]
MPVSADVVYLVGGLALLVAVALPTALRRAWLSAPVVLVPVGALIGLIGLPDGAQIDPLAQRAVVEHVTELTILIALMGVGLALDRPLSLLRRDGWRAWAATWKLLGIAMPLTIGAVFLLGWGLLGVAPAAALLLGAALAPTDPVLASDVQVDGPATESEEEIDERDEVRFALTSEAGLNDGLAFPFVYAAIFLATKGAVGEWGLEWLGWTLLGKVIVGVGVGAAVGWLLARIAFHGPAPSLRLAEVGEPLLALAALMVAYGAAEAAGGYGFLAVFACAMAMRSYERAHGFHEHMHEVIERLERLLTLVVLLLVGVALTDGALANLDWRGVAIAVALVFVIRPVSGLAALSLGQWRMRVPAHRPLERTERAVSAFFGVRGVGSIYYLAYALGHAHFPEARWLWSTVLFTIVLSVLVHGVAATPLMGRLEERREALEAQAGATADRPGATVDRRDAPA